MAKVISVFLHDQQVSAAGIQILVALTYVLIVIRFCLDAHLHRSDSRTKIYSLLMLDAANYSLLHYTLGVMQRPSTTNSYYQVWAVLLVTLRYSVKHGRPSGIRLRQTPLVDLMSSFWAANILRSRTVMMLKIPVWLLWSINSARIIHGFVSSEHATASHKDNVRMVVEYMRQEHRRHHQPSAAPATGPFSMRAYRYLVLGEAQQKKEARPPRYMLELKPTHKEKLVTLDRIWEWEHGDDGSVQGRKRVSDLLNYRGGMLKDLCLSFALYKLLRRRFYNLPIYESSLRKTKRLVFDGILGPTASEDEAGSSEEEADADVDRHKRVLRITKAELSFLNDFFYSRHALIFANGFPFLRLFLSSLLVGATAYMGVAVHRFSKIADEDEHGKVWHGVLSTWVILVLLGLKEIYEIAGYVFSDWTKVLLVCTYVRHPWWLRGPVMEMAVRLLCRYSLVKRWHGRIGQYNLVFGFRRRHRFASIDLPDQVQIELFLSLRTLGNPSRGSYLDKAFSAFSAKIPAAAAVELREKVDAKLDVLKGDVRRVLLWHIATCYCELHLADNGDRGVSRPWWAQIPVLGHFRSKATGIWMGPFVKQSELGEIEKHYVTAISLSQYCAHTLRLGSPLIPGNDIITRAVLDQVVRETRKALWGCYSIHETFAKLKDTMDCQSSTTKTSSSTGGNTGEDEATAGQMNDQGRIQAPGDTLLKMGSELGQFLIDATEGHEEARWDFLAQLWAGFVLHLAESTRASQHKIYLSMGGELMTHLWALLSHAGLMGDVAHGEIGGSAAPFAPDPQREALDLNDS